MNPKRSNRTILFLIGIMGIIGAIIISNVLFTMVTKVHFRSGKNIIEQKEPSNSNTITLQGKRGSIYDRNGEVIAQDEISYTMTAVLQPNENDTDKEANYVRDIPGTVQKLAEKLNVETSQLQTIIDNALANKSTQTQFGEIGQGISTAVKESIEELELPGIQFTKSVIRNYPTSVFASHLVGFAKYDDDKKTVFEQGIGLEHALDDYLKASNGIQIFEKDSNGVMLPGTKVTEKYAQNGDNVYLTLDHNVQQTLQASLAKTTEQVKAKRAWGIVMEAKTGKILGYASTPSYDLNTREGYADNFVDVPANYWYEPGSVMKGITYAAAIDSGNYPYNQKYNSGSYYFHEDENGKIYRDTGGSQVIKDAEGNNFGTITFDEGFVRSSNIAICELMANYMNPNIYKDYVEKFGFFKPVDIPFVNNEEGDFNFNYAIEKLSTGFGQSLSINALQMIQAFSAIVNGGEMVRPYVVDRIVDDSGKVVEQYAKKVVGNPITKETSDYMRDLMKKVIDEPFGTGHNRYKMDDVAVIAKTGTGQIFENGAYGSLYTNSVIAVAPYDNPQIIMYYAFESSDYKSFTGDPMKEVMKASLAAMNITKDSSNEAENKEENFKEWQEYTMPSLVNHSLDYANKKMESMDVTKIMVGNGASVISQFPQADDTIVTGQKVFLLTDGENITMPNMSGWTKKDVTAFWDLTGYQIQMEGSGSVVSQNIAEGTSINQDSALQVTMK